MIARLQESGAHVVVVDDERLCSELGSRKVLNIVMLAKALLAVNDPMYQNALCGKITLEDMREILPLCVKERFVSLNLRALDLVEQSA